MRAIYAFLNVVSAKLDALNNKLITQDRGLYLESTPGSTPLFIPGTNDPAQAIIWRDAFLKYAFPLAHNHENVILKQQDYPAVRFWTAESFRSWLSQQPKGEKRNHRGEIFKKDYFLEDKNGNLIPYSAILSIWQYLRDTFARVKRQMPWLLAPSCGRVDQALLNAICHELRIMHPELALCAHDWKILDLLSRWYSRWNKERSGSEDYFSESDEDEQDCRSFASLTGEASASNASDAMKRGLPQETTSMAFKRAKVEDPVGNPLQTVQKAPNGTVKFENIDQATLSDMTKQVPKKRRREPGSRRQKVTSSLEPRSTSLASILIQKLTLFIAISVLKTGRRCIQTELRTNSGRIGVPSELMGKRLLIFSRY